MFDLRPGENLLRVGYAYGLPNTGSDDFGAGAWYFAYTVKFEAVDEKYGTADALLNVIKDYYRGVPDGQEERVRGWNPNWGDAMNDIPEEHWAAFGLRLLSPDTHPSLYLDVDHDEAVYDLRHDVSSHEPEQG